MGYILKERYYCDRKHRMLPATCRV